VIDNVDLTVDQLADLRLGRGDYFGVAMAGVGNADATGKIEIALAIAGVEIGALGPLGHNVAVVRPDGC
jgi:hypothetical protein